MQKGEQDSLCGSRGKSNHSRLLQGPERAGSPRNGMKLANAGDKDLDACDMLMIGGTAYIHSVIILP